MVGNSYTHRYWKSPAGQIYTLFSDMAEQPHLLVAGATGSGKSVVVNGIIYNLLHKCPGAAGLILIDPKRVELVQYKDTPHCIMYASKPDTMVQALCKAIQITEARYTEMQRKRLRKYVGGDIYVIIDELADLMTTQRKTVQPIIQRLAQIGRAAKIHLIVGTQSPICCVIPTPIKVNFDSCVGLHTRCAQDSRNILGVTGCELLPRYGQGYYMTPEATRLYNIPMYTDEQIDRVVAWWTSTDCMVV